MGTIIRYLEIPFLTVRAPTPSHRAPGPPAHWALGHLREFRRDVLQLLLDSSRKYGDVIRFRLGPQVVHMVNHPDLVEEVLRRRATNYDKATRSARYIRAVCGESLLTSNGASWQCQRRRLQPFFHHNSVQRFATLMVDTTRGFARVWGKAADLGQPLDFAAEMMQLTYAIAAQAFFDAGSDGDARTIEAAMQVILPHTFGRLQSLFNWPDWVPTRQNRRFQGALRDLDAVVYRLIEQRRARPPQTDGGTDLLGMLLTAQDESGGGPIADQAIRDQTITFLLAGHETTSNALTWTFYLLARHPEIQDRLHKTVRQVLGDREPALADLASLAEVQQVLREAMRLFPPIWIIERRAIARDALAGFAIPAGSPVVVCPFTLHRDPRFWEKPDEFVPERFASEPPSAYLPFGTGPRYCIGSEFAMLEAQLVTARVVREFRLELPPGTEVTPWPGITLRTRSGLPICLTRRA